jgi:hypothetical protein
MRRSKMLVMRVLTCLLLCTNVRSQEDSLIKAPCYYWNGTVFASEGWRIPRLSKEIIKKHEEHYRYERKSGEDIRLFDTDLTVLVPGEPQVPVSIPEKPIPGKTLGAARQHVVNKQ